jgi:hypothetical protein
MTKIRTYQEFLNESLTIKLEQLPSIGDIVDKIHWKEGEKYAFIDFKGIKNIPVNIISNDSESASDTISPIQN